VPPMGDDQQRRLDVAAAASLVKSRDRDLYWTALFAPETKRPALLSLYAFHTELGHISARVSEAMVLQIRLQWWRDAIDLAAPGTRTGNPVADALADTICECNLPKDRLLRMIDGRLPEIFGDSPADIQALRLSLEETWGAVFELGAAILGVRGEQAKKAASYAGLSFGLTQLLASLPLQTSRKKLLLPASYFENRGVDLSAVYRGMTSAAFGAALADLRGAANRALQQFRAVAPELDKNAWTAFLPLTLVKPYLKAMSAPDYDPLTMIPTINPMRRFWRLWRAARCGTI
jgi:15-cis-phytoene synthase